MFGYALDSYELSEVKSSSTLNNNPSDTANAAAPNTSQQFNSSENTTFIWTRKTSSEDPKQAKKLSLDVHPKFIHSSDSLQARFQYGIAVNGFEATFTENNPPRPAGCSNTSIFLHYITLAIIVGFLLFVGFRQIFRGQVDWRRALIVMMGTGIIYFVGHTLFLMDLFGTFLTGGAEALLLVGQLIGSVAFGLFSGLAYIGWEALARDQKQHQINLVDAYWRSTFFYRESGEAILYGIAFGGLLTGLLTALMSVSDLWYYQQGGMFYNSLANSSYPWITLSLSLIVNAMVISLVGFGVIRSYLKELVQNHYIHSSISLLLLSGILLSPGLFATNGTLAAEFMILLVLVSVLLYIYDTRGIITLLISWMVFAGILLTSLIWDFRSISMLIASWGIATGAGLISLYGLAAYRFGVSVQELDGYVPEYEERLAHQMRVEKEIEIARESQFKLMPVKAPNVEGIDIYGFFMPSFEVGGDYFDYVPLSTSQNGEGAIAFAIADVSGKAMKAAMQAVFTSGLLLSRLHKDNPAMILSEISPTIYSRTDSQTFITCLVGQCYVQSRSLKFANAGHCRPILKRDRKASFIYTEDPKFPLGVRENVSYREKEVKMQEGDFILLYSDGLPEATDPKGHQFGFDNLLKLVESIDTENKKAKTIAQELKRHIQKFSDYQLADDTTLICLKI
jgi:hypothetical protein